MLNGATLGKENVDVLGEAGRDNELGDATMAGERGGRLLLELFALALTLVLEVILLPADGVGEFVGEDEGSITNVKCSLELCTTVYSCIRYLPVLVSTLDIDSDVPVYLP